MDWQGQIKQKPTTFENEGLCHLTWQTTQTSRSTCLGLGKNIIYGKAEYAYQENCNIKYYSVSLTMLLSFIFFKGL